MQWSIVACSQRHHLLQQTSQLCCACQESSGSGFGRRACMLQDDQQRKSSCIKPCHNGSARAACAAMYSRTSHFLRRQRLCLQHCYFMCVMHTAGSPSCAPYDDRSPWSSMHPVSISHCPSFVGGILRGLSWVNACLCLTGTAWRRSSDPELACAGGSFHLFGCWPGIRLVAAGLCARVINKGGRGCYPLGALEGPALWLWQTVQQQGGCSVLVAWQ